MTYQSIKAAGEVGKEIADKLREKGYTEKIGRAVTSGTVSTGTTAVTGSHIAGKAAGSVAGNAVSAKTAEGVGHFAAELGGGMAVGLVAMVASPFLLVGGLGYLAYEGWKKL